MREAARRAAGSLVQAPPLRTRANRARCTGRHREAAPAAVALRVAYKSVELAAPDAIFAV